MSLSCYVYYRVAQERLADARLAARAIVDAFEKDGEVRARLMTKDGEPLLWMEVYENIGDREAFLSALESLVNAAGIGRCLAPDSRRHIEMFQCA